MLRALLAAERCALARPSTALVKAPAKRTLATAAAGAKQRPLSPHLTIYTFRVNMITSVLFRGTGMVMTGGLAAVSISSLVGTHDMKYYIYQIQQYPLISALLKFGVAFPLTYHYLGGLRHLAWDNIIGHNWESMRRSGYAATGAAATVALIAMFSESEEN